MREQNTFKSMCLVIPAILWIACFKDAFVGHTDVKYTEIAGHHVVKILTERGNGEKFFGFNAVFQDRDGYYWIGHFFGADRYDEEKNSWTSFLRQQGDLMDYDIGMIGQSMDGKLWFASRYLGSDLICFDGEQWRKIEWKYGSIPIEKRATAIFSGQGGKLWFAVGHELMAYDNRPWDFSQLPKGLEIPRLVNPALEALTNPRRGISIIPSDENQHSKYTAVSGLQDSKGYVWLGTYAGIIRFDEGKNRVEVYDKKVAPGVMYEIYEDRKGRIWFANQYGSVYVYSNADGSWGSYNLLNQLPQSDLNELVLDHEGKKLFTISAIYEDNSGQLMFGTSQGLIVFSEKQNKWRLFTRENSKLISNIVVAIFEDRNGRIWLGTSTGIMVLEQ